MQKTCFSPNASFIQTPPYPFYSRTDIHHTHLLDTSVNLACIFFISSCSALLICRAMGFRSIALRVNSAPVIMRYFFQTGPRSHSRGTGWSKECDAVPLGRRRRTVPKGALTRCKVDLNRSSLDRDINTSPMLQIHRVARGGPVCRSSTCPRVRSWWR